LSVISTYKTEQR